MEHYFATVFGASLAAYRHQQFLRIVILILISSLIWSQFSSSISHRSVSAEIVDVDVRLSNTSRVVVATSSELQASSSKHKVEEPFYRHLRRNNFHQSSYVRTSLERQQKQQQEKGGGNGPEHHVNLRKLSSDFGCLANPSMCLTMPGLTAASNASTCCSTGFCTDLSFDGLNCGACGYACNFGYFCCSNVCVVTAMDPMNCGQCAKVCKGGVCMLGFCNY